MNRAYCMIRDYPVYRRDAFMAGLKAAGYDTRTGGPMNVRPDDVLCIWNRYGDMHNIATRVEQQGGIVIVAENGYVAPGGISPHVTEPREWYALAIGGHNGSGTWPVGGPERWDALGVDLKPWRTEGDHILVCPNRSFGRPGYIMPIDWPDKVVNRLRKVTNRPIRVRPHPGNGAHKTPLADDLKGAWAVCIWSSSAGVQSLIAGVPVIWCAPKWVCAGAGMNHLPINDDALEYDDADRLKAMRALAWAQFHHTEIASGFAFTSLLRRTEQAQIAASA